MSIGRLYSLRKLPAALVEGGVAADFTTISGSSATYQTISGSTITMNLATSNRLVTNQISGSTSNFNTNIGYSFSGSLAIFHRMSGSTGTFNLLDTDRLQTAEISGSNAIFHTISGSTGTYNLLDSDRATVADLSGSTAKFNVVSGSSTTFHKLSGSFASIRSLTVDHISARTFNSSVTTEQHLEIKNRQIIAAVSQSAGVSSEGAGLQIGGTAGTGSSGIASVVLGDAGGGAGADLLFKMGATQAASISTTGGRKNDAILLGISGSISGSAGILQELEVNRLTRSRSFSGSLATLHTISGSSATLNFIDVDRAQIADVSGSTAVYNSISGSGVVAHHLSSSTSTFNLIDADRATIADISGSVFNVQRLNIYGEISGSGTNTLIKKQHIHKSIVQNNNDSHGGLSFDSGRLSVGWRKKVYVRADGSNISGSVPTKGMFATNAMATPYTTASLGATPMSASLMVYLNGVLLHGDHPGQNPHGPTSADYRVNTASATSHVVLLNEELALDADDILTITFLSGSGINS